MVQGSILQAMRLDKTVQYGMVAAFPSTSQKFFGLLKRPRTPDFGGRKISTKFDACLRNVLQAIKRRADAWNEAISINIYIYIHAYTV